jgi:hypothetical protein
LRIEIDHVQFGAAVPSPGTVWLFGSTLIGVVGIRKKLKKEPMFNYQKAMAGLHALATKILNIQHRLNPLHIHCRLVERGLNKGLSISICKCYQVLFYSWFCLITVVAVKVCTLWDAHELSGLSSERAERKQRIALSVTATLVLCGSVALAIHVLFN